MLTYLTSALDDASSHQSRKIVAIYVLLFSANAAVWTWAFIVLAGQPTLLGTAFLAYVLGLRHAVDADHIAAIDNVVRKLMQEGKRPVSAGLFFSLGHSLVVTIAVAVIVGTAFVPFKVVRAVIGTGTSAFFLLTVAAINVVILRGVWRSFRLARRSGHAAIVIPTGPNAGRILIAGGIDFHCPKKIRRGKYCPIVPLASTELYDPWTNRFLSGPSTLGKPWQVIAVQLPAAPLRRR